MIAAENLTKQFGGQVLFRDINFKINSGERVGLVGRNGHGKTTLLRIIAGEEQPDGGSIVRPKNHRIGWVRQHISFTEQTVLAEGMLGLPEGQEDHFWKVEKVLSGLGFSGSDMGRHPSEFSGGYQVRLNLAKVLVSEPDLLLLDEPTNYLDIASIRWIEQHLCGWRRELLLVTHDRGFMDKVVTHTMAIHRNQIRKIKGTTEDLYARIAQDEETYEKTRANDERKRKQLEQFITRFRAKARLAGLVQSRVKALAKQEKREKLEDLSSLEFSFRHKPFRGKNLLSVENISFAYDRCEPIVSDFSLTVGASDRICIVGRNGQGKTTLLKLLSGTLEPQAGRTQLNPNAVMGFFEQTNVSSLVNTRTVEEEIICSDSEISRQKARDICGAMMFEGDSALKKIGVLSGGEKARVMMGKLLATPLNLLLLDEPTNHLDMDACDSLVAAIDQFEGAVVMVTHNELFLHALAQRLIVFQERKIQLFEGTYQEFLERQGWRDEIESSTQQAPRVEVKPEIVRAPVFDKKDVKRKRFEIIADRTKVQKPLERRVAELEQEIGSCEQQIEAFNLSLELASREGDSAKISEIAKSMHKVQVTTNGLIQQWENAAHELKEIKDSFDQRLAELEQRTQ